MLTNEQGGGQCDELVFTVEAETDVGILDPVQTLLVDSLKVHVNQINNQDLMYYFILYTGFLGFDSELVVTDQRTTTF